MNHHACFQLAATRNFTERAREVQPLDTSLFLLLKIPQILVKLRMKLMSHMFKLLLKDYQSY